MSYGSVRRAILTRFATYGKDAAPGQAPTEMRVNAPAKLEPVTLRTRLGGLTKGVPVLRFSKQGDRVDVWPAISIRNLGGRFRSENYHPGAEQRRNIGTAYQHSSVTGEEVSGPDLIEVLAHPDPEDQNWEIKIWSEDEDEGEELLELVKQIFPARTYLEVTTRDGCSHIINFMRTSGPVYAGLADDPTLIEGEPGSRFFAWVLTYVAEGYDDNTLEGELHPTIQTRTFESATPDADESDVETYTPDVPGRS